MTVDGEREPKAATALLAACLSDNAIAAPSIGEACAAQSLERLATTSTATAARVASAPIFSPSRLGAPAMG